jgi:Sec-independent protein translocase protein TatA
MAMLTGHSRSPVMMMTMMMMMKRIKTIIPTSQQHKQRHKQQQQQQQQRQNNKTPQTRRLSLTIAAAPWSLTGFTRSSLVAEIDFIC